MSDTMPQDAPPSKMKSLRRRLLTVVAALLVLFVVGHSVASWVTGRRLAHSLERINAAWGPLTAASLAPAPVPDRENRAKPLLAAIALLSLDQEQGSQLNNLRKKSLDQLSGEDLIQLKELLSTNRQSMELLKEAADRPRSNWEVPYEQTDNINPLSFIGLLKLLNLNHARLLVALKAGDEMGAAAAIRQGFAITESLAQEPFLTTQMIRMAGNRQNSRLVQRYLSFVLLNTAQVDFLDEAFLRSVRPIPMQQGLKAELALFSKWYREIGDLPSQLQSFPSAIMAKAMLILARPLLRTDFCRYLETMSQMIEAAEQPPHLQPDFAISPIPRGQQPKFGHFFSAQLIPNFLDAFSKGNQEQGRVALARTAIAIRRFQLATGRIPSHLEELVPDYLDEPPIDPFSGDLIDYDVSADSFTLRSAGAEGPPPPYDPLLEWTLPVNAYLTSDA